MRSGLGRIRVVLISALVMWMVLPEQAGAASVPAPLLAAKGKMVSVSVTLVNGTTIEGRVIQGELARVIFELRDGSQTTIEAKQIKRFHLLPVVAIEMNRPVPRITPPHAESPHGGSGGVSVPDRPAAGRPGADIDLKMSTDRGAIEAVVARERSQFILRTFSAVFGLAAGPPGTGIGIWLLVNAEGAPLANAFGAILLTVGIASSVGGVIGLLKAVKSHRRMKRAQRRLAQLAAIDPSHEEHLQARLTLGHKRASMFNWQFSF